MSNDTGEERRSSYNPEEKEKRDDNIVPREVLRSWGRISVHVGDKSLLQRIFRASLKEIELSDLGEEKEEAEYRVKYGISSYAPSVHRDVKSTK